MYEPVVALYSNTISLVVVADKSFAAISTDTTSKWFEFNSSWQTLKQ